VSTRAEVELGFEDKEIQAGLSNLEKRFAQFEKRVESAGKHKGGHEKEGFFGKEFSEKSKGLVEGIVAAESVRQLYELTEHFDKLNRLAIRLGTGVENMQRLDQMARMSDMDVETLVKGLEKMTRNLEDAESEPKVAKALEKLKLSAGELRRMNPMEQVLRLSDAMQESRESGESGAAGFEILGKAAGELFPLLLQDREELEKMSKAEVLSQDQVEKLAKFGDYIKASKIQLQLWAGEILDKGSDAVQIIMQMIDQMKYNPNIDSWKEWADAYERVLGAMGDEKAQQQIAAEESQKKAQAAKEEAEHRREIAAAQEKAAKRVEEEEKHAKELEKTRERMRESIRRQAEHNVVAQNSPLENQVMKTQELAELEDKLAQLREEEAEDENAGIDRADERLELERKIQEVKGELIGINKQIEEEERRAADLAKKHAEAAGDMKTEMEILQQRAAGHNRAADAMQRELELKKEAREIAEQLGITEAKALEIAKEKQRLEDKVKKQHPGTIHGYAGPGTTGVGSDHAGIDWLRGNRLGSKGGKWLDETWKFPALDRFQAMQRENKLTGTHKPADDKHRNVNLNEGEAIKHLLQQIVDGVKSITAY